MKKILMGVFAVLGVGFVLLVGYATTRPAEYLVSRQILIKAAPSLIFPHLNNARLFHAWSPWSQLDPKAQFTFTGPAEGVGAKTSWTGGEKLGTGSATITEVKENEFVKTKLEYSEPMKMEQQATLNIKQVGTETMVIWNVTGENNLAGRVMCLFTNMDKMVGDIFAQGLSSLKQKVEARN